MLLMGMLRDTPLCMFCIWQYGWKYGMLYAGIILHGVCYVSL
jgi:hypothetical protein